MEELGAYKSRIEQLGVPEVLSPRALSDATMSWPCTPSKADHRSSPAPGLYRCATVRLPSSGSGLALISLLNISTRIYAGMLTSWWSSARSQSFCDLGLAPLHCPCLLSMRLCMQVTELHAKRHRHLCRQQHAP